MRSVKMRKFGKLKIGEKFAMVGIQGTIWTKINEREGKSGDTIVTIPETLGVFVWYFNT